MLQCVSKHCCYAFEQLAVVDFLLQWAKKRQEGEDLKKKKLGTAELIFMFNIKIGIISINLVDALS